VLAALYAANPNADYLKLSPPGTIEVSDNGVTVFASQPEETTDI
jgi:hypothetical protein